METKIKVMQLTHFMTKSLTDTLKQFTWIAATNKLMRFYVVTIVPDTHLETLVPCIDSFYNDFLTDVIPIPLYFGPYMVQ